MNYIHLTRSTTIFTQSVVTRYRSNRLLIRSVHILRARKMSTENSHSSRSPIGKLYDKVAIVTGSTYGIGFSVAKRLAEDGAKVVISSRSKENVDKAVSELEPLFPDQIAGTVCHVQSLEDQERLVQFTLEKFGKINLLVANAAVNPHVGDLSNIQESQWDKIFSVNVKSVFMLSRKVITEMLKNEDEKEKGAIVYISSAVAYTGMSGIGAYATSKTALLGLSKNMSLEFAPQKIRVNVVAPGLIYTKFSEVLWSKYEDVLISKTHMKRLGEQDEVSGTVSFLCGPDASYITGENITVAGGYQCGL